MNGLEFERLTDDAAELALKALPPLLGLLARHDYATACAYGYALEAGEVEVIRWSDGATEYALASGEMIVANDLTGEAYAAAGEGISFLREGWLSP